MKIIRTMHLLGPYGSRLAPGPEGVGTASNDVVALAFGRLVFDCPVTARDVDSGIGLHHRTFLEIGDLTLRACCPHCQRCHEWVVNEGRLVAT